MLCGISDSNLDKWEHFTSLGGYHNTGNTDWALRFCMRKNWFIHQVKDDIYITGEQSVLELYNNIRDIENNQLRGVYAGKPNE